MSGEHLSNVTIIPVTKRTPYNYIQTSMREYKSIVGELTVMVSLAWIVGENDFEATVWSVVGPLALFTIAVSHIVCILLLKLWEQKQINTKSNVQHACAYNSVHLLWFHFLDKLCSPEGHSLVQCESNALEEQSVLYRRPKCLRWCSLRRVSYREERTASRPTQII